MSIFQAQQLNPEELMNNPPQIVVTATTPDQSSILPTVSSGAPTPESIQIPSISTKSSSTVKWSSPSTASPGGPLKPWTGAALEPRKYKPIKVDNWGIFLLSRLQAYFQKKEYTDLTLRFPDKNAQIKVHKLVVNACTDYFIKQEEAGLIQDGVFDMPSLFLPELVAPIIRFMYTGRLDMKSNILFTRLRDTAVALGMLVLAKLLDAQINAPPAVFQPQMKKKKVDSDPIKQIKRIKKIEKKFERDALKRNSIMISKQHLESDKIIPGKKLPIWKKRETQVNSQMNELDIKQEVQASPKAYGKSGLISIQTQEQGRQLREIQENANFEKVRQSSSKAEEIIAESNNDETHEDQDQDEDDYYDNDAGLDYDEAIADEDNEEENNTITSDLDLTPKTIAKPILKSAEKDVPLPRKSVRFSLRPGLVSGNKVESKTTEIITPDTHHDDTTNDDIAESTAEIKSPPKKRKTESDAMDKTVEEFSKAIEQEEQEDQKPKTTRRGRVIHAPNLESPSESPVVKKSPRRQTTPSTPAADHTPIIAELMRKNPEMFKGNKPVKIKVMTKDAKGKNVVKVITVKAQPTQEHQQLHQKSIDLTPKSSKSPTAASKASSSLAAEKSTDETESPAMTKVSFDANGSISLRTTPKVKYTGKRGRPPIIKLGETDPHAKERAALENNFKAYSKAQMAEAAGEAESFANFEEVI